MADTFPATLTGMLTVNWLPKDAAEALAYQAVITAVNGTVIVEAVSELPAAGLNCNAACVTDLLVA